MQGEPSIHGPLCKRPHDDIGLEPHVSALARGKKGAGGGTDQTGYATGVAGEEALLASGEVLDDDFATKGVDKVFTIGVAYQPTGNRPYKHSCIKLAA